MVTGLLFCSVQFAQGLAASGLRLDKQLWFAFNEYETNIFTREKTQIVNASVNEPHKLDSRSSK